MIGHLARALARIPVGMPDRVLPPRTSRNWTRPGELSSTGPGASPCPSKPTWRRTTGSSAWPPVGGRSAHRLDARRDDRPPVQPAGEHGSHGHGRLRRFPCMVRSGPPGLLDPHPEAARHRVHETSGRDARPCRRCPPAPMAAGCGTEHRRQLFHHRSQPTGGHHSLIRRKHALRHDLRRTRAPRKPACQRSRRPRPGAR